MDIFCGCVIRRCFIALIFLLSLGHTADVLAESAPASGCQASSLSLIGNGEKRTNIAFFMDKDLQVKASGGCFEAVSTQLKETGGESKFTLVLDHVRMANLPVTVSEIAGQQEIILTFQLIRRSEDDDNRKAWDALLGKQHGGYEFTIPVALAVGGQPAWEVPSAPPAKLHLANNTSVWMTFAAGITIFLVVYSYLVKHPSVLRDRSNGYYSLGKSQMVFWGLLVILTFAGLWLLTGKMEAIPPGVLALIGISAATSLGSKTIGDSKKLQTQSPSPGGSANSPKEETSGGDKTQSAPSSSGSAPSEPENKSRMDESKQAQVTPGFYDYTRDAGIGMSAHQSAGFWQDICDDGNGMSFHRLQVVMWTLVLGVIFLDAVGEAISMPEFPKELLALQGMSNGTYLGFKIPEKTT